MRSWKWGRYEVLVRGAEDYEAVEVPVYKSVGGPLFKTLLSSACRMDCRYCPFSRYCRVPRIAWPRGKLVRAFMAAHAMGLVGGLFLSSGLYADPERVSSDIVAVAGDVRRAGFRGYIALRLMPGTPRHLIREALSVADRVGLNLEAPTPSGFEEIAPSKGSWSLDILSPLLYAASIAGSPYRVSTQLVVGASGESDRDHLLLASRLLEAGVGVIHYSPYTPIPGTPLASKRPATPLWRVRRLYEAEALMRDYGFKLDWILDALDDEGMLPPGREPLKEVIARLNPGWFPVNPAEAGWGELVRVPGIGPRAARAIIGLRESGRALNPRILEGLLGRKRWVKARPYLDLGGART